MDTLFLGFDTETTGLPKGDYKAPNNVRVCQLAAKLCDAQGNTVQVLNHIIKPEGWTIPPEVAKIHGITQERAEKEGVPMLYALSQFVGMLEKGVVLIAHNNKFDLQMLDIEFWNLFKDPEKMLHRKSTQRHICTMTATKDICKLPPTFRMQKAGFNTYKAPKLIEAYKFVFGTEFDKAHDAMNDVNAMMAMFFELVKRGSITI